MKQIEISNNENYLLTKDMLVNSYNILIRLVFYILSFVLLLPNHIIILLSCGILFIYRK